MKHKFLLVVLVGVLFHAHGQQFFNISIPALRPRINSTAMLDLSIVNPAFSGMDSFSTFNIANGNINGLWINGGVFHIYSTDSNGNNKRVFVRKSIDKGRYFDLNFNTRIDLKHSTYMGISILRSYEDMDAYMKGEVYKLGLSLITPLGKWRASLGFQFKYENWNTREPIEYPNVSKEYVEFDLKAFEFGAGCLFTDDRRLSIGVSVLDLSRNSLSATVKVSNFYNTIESIRNYSVLPYFKHTIQLDDISQFEYECMGLFTRRLDWVGFITHVTMKFEKMKYGFSIRNLDNYETPSVGPILNLSIRNFILQYNYLTDLTNESNNKLRIHEFAVKWRIGRN